MSLSRYSLAVVASVACAAGATAQPNLPGVPMPRLQSVAPCGAKAGTTVEVGFAGTELDDPEALIFSHPGLKAEAIVPPAPPPPKPDPKADPKKPAPPPAKLPITRFKVTVAADAPLGPHDVRLVNKWGVSNPRAFVVGDLVEIEEKEPNNDVPVAQKVALDTTINGTIGNPTDVDFFTIAGKKGQRVLAHAVASSIDSRARPAVEVYDPSGRRLTFNTGYRDNDALADVTLPADGEYLVRLFGFAHTSGNADSFYRLSLTTAPWIDAVVPALVEPGKTASVTVWGRNLPGGQPDPTAIVDGRMLEKVTAPVTAPTTPTYRGWVPPPMANVEAFEFRVRNAVGSSNAFPIGLARAPVAVEVEGNDKPETPQAVAAPCEIAGRLDRIQDRDWYAVAVRKGEVLSIELFGDRLGSPADFYIAVKSGDGKQSIAEGDDNAEILHPRQFFTRNSDPQPIRYEVKEDGRILVMVAARDGGTEYGPRHLYRLRIAREKPDFQLILMPASDNRPEVAVARSGGEQMFDVLAWREGGFVGPIDLEVTGLPAGVTAAPQRIGPILKTGPLVVAAAADAKPGFAAIAVRGTATIDGQKVTREAKPATITWAVPPQQNIPTIVRLDRQAIVAVRDKAPFRLVPGVDKLTVKAGDKATIPLKATRIWPEFKGPIAVQLVTGAQQNQPLIPSVTMQAVTIAPDKTDATATVQVGGNAPPGVYTLVLRGTSQFNMEKGPKGQKQNVGLDQPTPPIVFTIVPASLGTVSANMANANVKPGASGELIVKVSRLHNYAGEYKVKVVVPAGVKGVTVAEGTVPAGKDEVKLAVAVAGDAKPGNVPNLVVQATATFEGTPVASETKFNGLTVVK